jgi:hypothetical protein
VEGQWEQLSIRRLGPWEVELTPFPFAGEHLEVEVERVHLDPLVFGSTEELRAAFDSARPATQRTVYRARQD